MNQKYEPYIASKRILHEMLHDVAYSFNRFFLRGFHAQKGYLSHSISVDEFEELEEWFPGRKFTRAELLERIQKRDSDFTEAIYKKKETTNESTTTKAKRVAKAKPATTKPTRRDKRSAGTGEG